MHLNLSLKHCLDRVVSTMSKDGKAVTTTITASKSRGDRRGGGATSDSPPNISEPGSTSQGEWITPRRFAKELSDDGAGEGT